MSEAEAISRAILPVWEKQNEFPRVRAWASWLYKNAILRPETSVGNKAIYKTPCQHIDGWMDECGHIEPCRLADAADELIAFGDYEAAFRKISNLYLHILSYAGKQCPMLLTAASVLMMRAQTHELTGTPHFISPLHEAIENQSACLAKFRELFPECEIAADFSRNISELIPTQT